MTAAPAATRPHPVGLELRPIDAGWEVAPADDSAWIPASVPGTVAGAYRDAGLPTPEDVDAREWRFRTRFEAEAAGPGEELVLRFGGIATLSEILLDGVVIAKGESMFASVEVDVTDKMGGSHELTIRCLALAPRLAEPRRPRARWRTALVTDGNLRWFRTSLLGRAPGFSPGPPVVGPWRPITLERRRAVVVDQLSVRARLDADEGLLVVRARVRSIDAATIDAATAEIDGPSGRHAGMLAVRRTDGGAEIAGELRIPAVARWWPHTHGTPNLHTVRLMIQASGAVVSVDGGRVGFRTLTPGPGADHDVEADGLDLHVNGVPVFARGAVWTPVDPIGVAATRDELQASLELVRDAGMNMLRIAGTGLYESAEFHDLCDELGILVWQDLLFANLDYPFVDEAFRTVAVGEARAVVEGLAQHPSTAVVCGNSEVEQQVAMLGLDPGLGRDPFYAETLPSIAVAADAHAVVIPSAPFGGDLPFRPDRGVANYYGVGGYRRPLSDARLASVRFAAECLALSNVADGPLPSLADPAWKAGIPRDRGADWDFEDVRDHYLGLLYEVDPEALRRDDPDRYVALSRAVSGEVMADVFGEWRRAASPCGGGLVLWWRDVVDGAGWGLLDRSGRPKTAYHHLRRALASTAVWMSDEGLGGIAVHVANDGPDRLVARLRVALYRDHELLVGSGEELLELPPHAATQRDIEAVIGHFVDVSWAYRFGPAAQDVVVATLESVDGDPARPIGQAFRFPVGRPAERTSADDLGLRAVITSDAAGRLELELQARRVVHGVRIDVSRFLPTEDAFTIEPGHARRIDLAPIAPDSSFRGGRVTAINLAGSLEVPAP
jgi:beta-mannosidase